MLKIGKFGIILGLLGVSTLPGCVVGKKDTEQTSAQTVDFTNGEVAGSTNVTIKNLMGTGKVVVADDLSTTDTTGQGLSVDLPADALIDPQKLIAGSGPIKFSIPVSAAAASSVHVTTSQEIRAQNARIENSQ